MLVLFLKRIKLLFITDVQRRLARTRHTRTHVLHVMSDSRVWKTLLTTRFVTEASQVITRMSGVYLLTEQFADKPTRGQSSRGLVNSRTTL